MENKTVLVTGGTRGIGKTIGKEFAKLGYNIVLNYRNETRAQEVEQEFMKLGAKVLKVKGDVSKLEDAEYIFSEAVKVFGKVDILINNAGITRDNLAIRMTEEEFNQVIDVNLKGAFYFMKLAGRHMMKNRGGRIISIASISGLRGNPGQINYSASKAGLIAMTKTLALELASKNITCNCVAPGFIETDMTDQLPNEIREIIRKKIPLRQYGKPMDVANAVLFLASDSSSYITGQVISVDGGLSI